MPGTESAAPVQGRTVLQLLAWKVPLWRGLQVQPRHCGLLADPSARHAGGMPILRIQRWLSIRYDASCVYIAMPCQGWHGYGIWQQQYGMDTGFWQQQDTGSNLISHIILSLHASHACRWRCTSIGWRCAGITCRWASTHGAVDCLSTEHLKGGQALGSASTGPPKPADDGAAAEAAELLSSIALPPAATQVVGLQSHPCSQQEVGCVNSTAASCKHAAGTIGTALNNGTIAGPAVGDTVAQVARDSVTSDGQGGESMSGLVSDLLKDDGSIPEGIVTLAAPPAVQSAINNLDKSVQARPLPSLCIPLGQSERTYSPFLLLSGINEEQSRPAR